MQRAAAAGLVAAAALLCYANSLGNGFVFDDSAYLSSEVVRRFALGEMFFARWLDLDLYRPLTLLSLALDYLLYGEAPAGYHLSNLLLHLANGLLFYALALRLMPDGGALVAALLWVVHPLQSEVVNWVSARGDLLVGFFFCLGLIGHIHSDDKELGRERRLWRLFAWGCCAAAALAKETGFLLPFAAWWYDACFRGRAGLPWLRRHWGYAAVLVLVLGLRWVASGAGGSGPASTNFLAQEALGVRLLTLGAILLRYSFLVVFPLRLSADYSYDSMAPVTSFFDVRFWGGALVLLGSLSLVWRWRGAASSFAWGLLGASLLPVANLFFLPPSALAERYLYLPLLAICLLSGLAVAEGGRRLVGWRRRAGIGAIAFLLCLGAARTAARNGDWESDYALFAQVLRHYPRNARAHENLGRALYERGDVEGAIDHYRRALAIRPENVRAHIGLGRLYAVSGRYEAAALAYESALSLHAGHVEAHYDLGRIYHRLGRYREAARHFQEVLQLRPGHQGASLQLSRMGGAQNGLGE